MLAPAARVDFIVLPAASAITFGRKMSSYPVYLNRPWMNHSANAFSGWTITVKASTGALVVAALALLVQMAGEAMWSIVAFCLHQRRTKNRPETGLFRQMQVVLRNPNTSLSTSVEILRAGWVWHGIVDKALRKSVMLACWPVLIFIGFTAAGVFVSTVTVPAYKVNQILLEPTNCGMQNWHKTDDLDLWTRMVAKWANDARQSRAHATECYNKPNKTLGCTSLPAQQLPYTVSTNVSCPLGQRCLEGVNFDTGLLDSHKHLGINAKASDRVNFQLSTTCAPIDISDTYSTAADPFAKSEFFLLRVKIGTNGIYNYTYSYPTVQSVQQIPYTIEPVRKMAGPAASSGDKWQPVPAFRINNADLTLAFVAFNNVQYNHPVYDPVFSANGTYSVSLGNMELNLPDHWISTVACTDQLRICNPVNRDMCSPLTGAFLVRPMGLGLNTKQEATAERIIDARLHSTIFDMIYQQSGTALMASDLLVDLISPPVPNNQWVLEVERWFQTAMANIQRRIVEFPNNEWDTDTNKAPNVVPPNDWFNFSSEAMEGLCHQQLVRSTDQYQSFSLAGILIVIIISVAIIITSWTLESCVFRRKDRQPGGRKRYKRLASGADGKLQLLRAVLQSAGYGAWKNEFDDTPYRRPPNRLFQRDIEPVTEVHGSVFNAVQLHDMHNNSVNIEDTDSSDPYRQQSFERNNLAVMPGAIARPCSAPSAQGFPAPTDDSIPLIRRR